MVMSNRFEQLKEAKKPLFIPFIVAGDPSPEITVDIALSLQEAGADVLELGIPYSDPLADGPVIQEAAKRALQQKMTIEKAIKLVSEMRKNGLTIPIVIFSYYNLILQLGMEQFIQLAKQNEVDGLLIPDLPFEESEGIRDMCNGNGLSYISLVAPTTSNERLQLIAEHATGFLYAVSSLGVTGERQAFHNRLDEFLRNTMKYSSVPVALGFGVSSKQQFDEFGSKCDGVIIGSAIVRKIAELQPKLIDRTQKEEAIREFVHYIKSISSGVEETISK